MRQLALCLLLLPLLAAVEPAGPAPTIPVEKDRWLHDEYVAVAKAGGVDLLFIGDSITYGWGKAGKPVWDKYFAPLKAANFGIGGDVTQNVIWRVRNGELEGIQPKLVVLMIGSNNTEPAGEVALGIKVILDEIRARSPRSKILLLGILPRSEGADRMTKYADTNLLIASYTTQAPVGRVVFLDIGGKFLDQKQVMSKDLVPDFIHPGERGYQVWADAIIDTVMQLMRNDPTNPVPLFAPASTVPKVAKVEESIAQGRIGPGVKALEKLVADKDARISDAAKASLGAIATWKGQMDADLARLKEAGDVYAAAALADGLADGYADTPDKAIYHAQALEWKKDPAYAAGKEFQKLAAIPFTARKDPQFAKLVAAFAKKYPGGFYAQQAEAMLPGK